MTDTILCADDDRNLCQILVRAFRQEGYRVETAHDGESAISKILAIEPSLVLLDVLLPRLDGFSVLEAIRRGPAGVADTPVILFSGCTFTPTYEKRAHALRADALLNKPVPLDQLLTLVAEKRRSGRGNGAARGPAAVRSRSPRREPPETLSGHLDQVPLPALLHHLHGLRASGVLRLQNGKKKKLIQLRDGHPVAVRSNLVNECLGNLLVASGTITWDVMHESLRRVRDGEGLQGQILVAMHMLDEEDLARALHNQAEERLFEAFAWEQGGFRFDRGLRLRDANAMRLKRGSADVILKGVRERLPLGLVDRFLAERAAKFPVPGESPFYRFQELPLDRRAEEQLRSVDGTRPLADFLDGDEADRRTLYALLTLEILELREGPVEPASAHPGAGTARSKDTRAKAAGGARQRAAETARQERATRRRPTTAASPRSKRSKAVGGAERAGAKQAPPSSSAAARAESDEGIRMELAAMAERLRGRDCFGVLGVDRRADDEAVRRAFTDLAKRTHPDRFAGAGEAVLRLAEEVFGLISHAHERLATREGRLTYMRDMATRERDAAEIEEGQRALRAELEFQKGETALQARRYEAAAVHFRAAVEAYPEEGDYRAYYGWALYLSDPRAPGRIREALEHVRAGRKLAPDREKPYLFLGRLYKADGRMKIAEKMFTRAVQLDPDCVEALRELRLIHMRREKSKGLVRRILRR